MYQTADVFVGKFSLLSHLNLSDNVKPTGSQMTCTMYKVNLSDNVKTIQILSVGSKFTGDALWTGAFQELCK